MIFLGNASSKSKKDLPTIDGRILHGRLILGPPDTALHEQNTILSEGSPRNSDGGIDPRLTAM